MNQVKKLSPYLLEIYNKVTKFNNAAKLYAILNNMEYISLVNIIPRPSPSYSSRYYVYDEDIKDTINILKMYIPRFRTKTFLRIFSVLIDRKVIYIKQLGADWPSPNKSYKQSSSSPYNFYKHISIPYSEK